jgi:hypothetical protein
MSGIGVEWENLWHPELEEPEVAFADYAQVAAGCVQTARSR